MVSCFRKRDIGIRQFSSIETKSHHTTTRVIYVIGYTRCTQIPGVLTSCATLGATLDYKFSLPLGSYIETCTSFYVFSGPRWLVGWIGYWTPIKLPYCSSASHHWMPRPAPAPLASTHCGLAVCVAVWRNLPSVASTGPIFRQSKIVTFVTMASWHNGHRCCLIKTRRNNRKCNRKQLLDVIYTGVGVGGGVPPLSASASSISAIFHLNTSFSTADIFLYARSTSLFFCSSNRPYAVLRIVMGASLSAMSSALSISVYKAWMPTSSMPPSANCW
jgi:hypothetical protein